eukprot:390485_1
MGKTPSKGLSSSAHHTYTFPDDASILLPVPLSLNTPDSECMSLQSLAYHPYASTPSALETSDIHTPRGFCFDSSPMSQISDCWNSFNPQHFEFNNSPEMAQTIHRTTKSDSKNDWMSVFGAQIIRNGDYKIWKLKIYPRNDAIQSIINHKEYPIADLVVGVVDVESVMIDDSDQYNESKGEFWRKPYTGYGYCGSNGKRFHQRKRGKAYGQKFKVGDVITIELDLIQCNELTFFVNGISNGVSFDVDG